MPDAPKPNQRLRLLRKEAGMSQSKLAAAADIGYSTVQRLESATQSRSVGVGPAMKVAKVLDVDVALIYDGDDLPRDIAGLRADEPPAWAQEMLDELHALRAEIEECTRERQHPT
jgi:transcriptional regulator with XRE-family HTH domain